MTGLRLLADDLTGALDSASRFVPLTGPVAATWRSDAVPDGPVAIDSGTRDLSASAARVAIERFAPLLDGGAPAFKKIDSLLRGHVALELAACTARFDHCILAPAFPFQGRITRGGRQLVRDGDGWRDTGVELPGLRLRDAASDADLDAIVAEGRALPGRVLWCGTGGLAGALAGHLPVPRPDLPLPILALIGSDHAVSAAQVSAARSDAVVTAVVPSGTPRDVACRLITAQFVTRLSGGERPGTLFVTGGETLRSLCDALGVMWLEVDGEIEPGVPTSILRGGAWDGQRLVSKSGAFGDSGFLRRLLGGA